MCLLCDRVNVFPERKLVWRDDEAFEWFGLQVTVKRCTEEEEAVGAFQYHTSISNPHSSLALQQLVTTQNLHRSINTEHLAVSSITPPEKHPAAQHDSLDCHTFQLPLKRGCCLTAGWSSLMACFHRALDCVPLVTFYTCSVEP